MRAHQEVWVHNVQRHTATRSCFSKQHTVEEELPSAWDNLNPIQKTRKLSQRYSRSEVFYSSLHTHKDPRQDRTSPTLHSDDNTEPARAIARKIPFEILPCMATGLSQQLNLQEAA